MLKVDNLSNGTQRSILTIKYRMLWAMAAYLIGSHDFEKKIASDLRGSGQERTSENLWQL